MHTAKTLRYT